MKLQPPMNETVRWDPGERVIGVVGVAPAATADFYQKLVKLTPVRKDWEHVRVLIDSNPKIPSRGRYFELNETDPVPFIRQSIQELHQWGASVIALPCNTAHILYDRYAADLPDIFIPHMIYATVDALLRKMTDRPKRVAVMASRLTMQHGLYRDALAAYGIVPVDVSESQEEVSSLIEGVKQGRELSAQRERMRQVLARFPDADSVILGCTELSLLLKEEECSLPLVDSNVALAEACLALAQNRSP